jgi:hypothetical protein
MDVMLTGRTGWQQKTAAAHPSDHPRKNAGNEQYQEYFKNWRAPSQDWSGACTI